MVLAFPFALNIDKKVESVWGENSLLENIPPMILPSFNPEGISSPKL